MNLYTDENDIKWFTDLKESIKPEYSAIKVTSPLSFYRLKGRVSVMAIENIIPLENVSYTVYSKAEDRYYLHEFRNYPVEQLYFYKPCDGFLGDDLATENLRRYIMDGNIHILLTPEQVSDTSDMLARLWKSHFGSEGKLDYRIYIELLDASLKFQDYKGYGSSHTGFKTVCNMMQQKIDDLWRQAGETKK